MAGRVNKQAFVSLATNNGYALGALVLGHSLRSVNTNRQLALMITQEVDSQVRQELLGIWDRLIVVDVLDSEDSANLALLQRPDLGITFTKLHAWKLVEYEKCVFLDADTLVLQNVDDLFNRPEISAAPDIGWPDCFNSGVFVFVPSIQTHDALIAHALAVGSFDGGDQGLLNSYFNNWLHLGPEHRLPFVYNLHSNSSYTYSPAFKRFGSNVKIVHFIGRKKPWQYTINLETGKVIHDHGIISVTSSERFIQQWWDVYNEISAHRITEDVGQVPRICPQESFHPTLLQIGSDSEDSEHSESDSIHEVETITGRIRTQDDYHGPHNFIIAPVITAPALIPNQHSDERQNEHNHSYAIYPLSTPSLTSQSHEINELTSNVGNLQFRSFTEESHAAAMTSPQDSLGRWRWEYGQIDYGGVDSFENIQRRLDETLSN